MHNFNFRNARLLIVDDEQSNIRQLEKILELFGFAQVSSTTDSREAVTLYKQMQPDIVLLDLHMPEVSGFDVMDRLRETEPKEKLAPILVLTGDGSVETKRRALAGGARDLVLKPFDHFEVVLRIKSLLENRSLQLALRRQNEALEAMVHERTAELERTMAQLRSTHEQMVRQERLKAVGLMASGIAHDFNNSLTMMLGYGELLTPWMESHAGEREQEYLKCIIDAAKDASQVVNRLREFYRAPESGELRTPVSLNEVVQQAVTLTAPKWSSEKLAAGVQVKVVTNLQPTAPVLGIAAELREALTNLIFNAVDAMPEGGQISLSTRQDGPRVYLTVQDNGNGMTVAEKERCLEPFYSTKGHRGTGLGLSVVYGIIERHGGTLTISSEKTKGTTFTIVLPETKPVASSDEPEGALLPKGLRVLVVDDRKVISRMVGEHLQREGFITEDCESAIDALERFRQQPFDLVITDRSMPEISGTQLAAEMKAIAPQAKVILLSGFDSEGPDGTKPRAVDYVLKKPISITDLLKAMRQVFAGRAGTMEVAPTLMPAIEAAALAAR